MGIFTGILGFTTTLFALLIYAEGCYINLPSEINSIKYSWRLGPAFYCVLVATLLKPIDALINLLVPVPQVGYWDPDRDKSESTRSSDVFSNSKKEPLLQLEDGRSEMSDTTL